MYILLTVPFNFYGKAFFRPQQEWYYKTTFYDILNAWLYIEITAQELLTLKKG